MSILNIISNCSCQSPNGVPLKLQMAEIGNFTPSLNAALWLTLLNKHLRPHLLQPDDELLAVGDVVGTALNQIFRR